MNKYCFFYMGKNKHKKQLSLQLRMNSQPLVHVCKVPSPVLNTLPVPPHLILTTTYQAGTVYYPHFPEKANRGLERSQSGELKQPDSEPKRCGYRHHVPKITFVCASNSLIITKEKAQLPVAFLFLDVIITLKIETGIVFSPPRKLN